jgi:DNA-binding transcriptional regulator LsrR (DeoR family)
VEALHRTGLLARVSALYYLDGRTQAAIAERLRLSRPKVSRLLLAAREAGIARITVTPPRGVLVDLETELESRFGLLAARVVPRAPDDPPEWTRRQIGMAAAADLARSVRPGAAVALTGGALHAAMVDASGAIATTGVRVVQGVGWERATPAAGNLMGLVHELARRVGGSAVVLPAPAVVPDEAVRRGLAADPHIGDALRALDRLDTVYVEVRRGVAGVGSIALRHFDRAGTMLGAAADGHVVGITVEQLRGAGHVVALASGAERRRSRRRCARS